MKEHWENIFQQKDDEQHSWYQSYPSASIECMEELQLPKEAAIIDVGGGDSKLVDASLEKDYSNITVLDISAAAIGIAKRRLGKNAKKVKWVVNDILNYHPNQQFDLWHDRAAFHFFTEEEEIKKYVQVCEGSVASGGYLILGTFSEEGPKKCSGLSIKQYSQTSMSLRFDKIFGSIKCKKEIHITPSKTAQNFLFCSFKKKP